MWHETKDFWKKVDEADVLQFSKMETTREYVSMVVFRLPNMEVGLVVIICGCCGEKVGETMFLDNRDIEISFDIPSR